MAETQETPILENFQGHVKIFLQSVEASTKNAPKWFVEFKKHLHKFTAEMENTVGELESKLCVQQSVTDALHVNKEKMEERMLKLEKDLEESQQYSRRTNVLIHGVEEEPNEDTDTVAQNLFTERMGLPIIDRDIARSHRLGRRVEGSNRPIIVRLLSYRQKKTVYDSKKQLKSTGISITENLTKKRYEFYKKCKDKFGMQNVTTLDGRIFHYTGKLLPNGKTERRHIGLDTVL